MPCKKCEYQKLSMGMCNSPDIFKEKTNELCNDLEYLITYIDHL